MYSKKTKGFLAFANIFGTGCNMLCGSSGTSGNFFIYR